MSFMLLSVLHYFNRLPSWVLIFISALGVGLHAPGFGVNLLGLVAYFPLFVVLDRIHQSSDSRGKKSLYTLLACWGVGVGFGTIGLHWMVFAIHVFGHLPWIAAIAITALLYGLLVGITLFILCGLPLFFVRRWGWWDIPVRLMFIVLLDPFYPRLLQWSFGGFTFSAIPWIAQVADIVGEWGLSFYAMGMNLLLLLFWRWKISGPDIKLHVVRRVSGVFALLLLVGLGYGVSRETQLQPRLSEGVSLHVAAIQPNFSLNRIAVNPDLTYSNRKKNVLELLKDSEKALDAFPKSSSIPKLVIWPESTYPFYFFRKNTARKDLERFARKEDTAILLASMDKQETPEGSQKSGLSILIGPDGEVRGSYAKIALMPFGEYIPWGKEFPAYRQWLKKMIPQIGLYEPGNEFTVYELSEDIQFSGSICFDVFSDSIVRNMVRNGASFVVNLSNLAWYGYTNASRQLEMGTRWRAIENRVPMLYISNGETMFIDPLGDKMGETLGLFEQDSLSRTIILQQHFSFYREYKEWVHLGAGFLFLITLLLAQIYGHIFSTPEASE